MTLLSSLSPGIEWYPLVFICGPAGFARVARAFISMTDVQNPTRYVQAGCHLYLLIQFRQHLCVAFRYRNRVLEMGR
jgi:hypothetical protein